jgi:hypothetical protein
VAAADAAAKVTMAKDDPSVLVRAAAVRALGSAPGQEGYKALRESLMAVSASVAWQHRLEVNGPGLQLGLLLRALGADAEPAALAVLKDGDQKSRETVAAAILYGDLPRRDGFRDALISLLIERKISDELGASVLAGWPNDPAVTTVFNTVLNDVKFRNLQPTVFGYLLPLQSPDKALDFLAEAATKTLDHRVRGEAVTALVDRKAFEVLGQRLASAKGQAQGALLYPLFQAAKTPEAKTFAVAQVKQKLEAGANPAELGLATLPSLGADAAPLLPLLKAIKTEDANFQKQIADIVAQIERQVAASETK